MGLDFYDESIDLVKNNQDNELNDNKITNLDTVTVNRDPSSGSGLSTKNYTDEKLLKITIVRFNQTLEIYLKVSVGNNTCNITKYNEIQLTDTKVMKTPNSGGYCLQIWNIKCNDKNNNGKIQNFNESTKTNSPTGNSGATSLPPIGDSFMYIETSSTIMVLMYLFLSNE